MKNTILLFFILFLNINLSAQTFSGNKFINLSSNLNYTSQTVDFFGTKTTSSIFLLDAQVGYFIIDNLALTSRLTHLLSGGSSSTSLSFGGRYYINNLYAGCDLVLAEPTTLKFNAGYAIFINEQLAIEPSLTYSKINEFTSSLSMMVGFAMYL